MKRGRSFLILLVLALGVGGYAYFVESEKDLTDPATKHAKTFAIESNKIEEVQIKAASGEATTVKKKDTTWQITAPEALDVDASTITAVVSTLESLETQETVDPKPATVKQYGLEPPRFSVGARLFGETTMHTLKVGNKTPNGSDLYAQVEGEPAVILISGYLEESLNKTPFDLRDKTVLKFAHDGVESVKVEAAGDPTLTLTKKDAQWRITTPVDARADFSAADGIVTRVDQLRMKSLVTADGTKDPKDAKTYGFDKPQAVVTIGVGSTRAALAIGAKKDESTVYARDLSRPMVFTVESAVLADVKKKADDLRVKDLFEFRSFNTSTLDITSAGKAFSFVRTPAPPPPASPAPNAPPATDTWKQTAPAAKDINLTAITDLITNISGLRADKFTDKPLTTGDEFTVSAKFGEPGSEKTEKVTFRKSKDVVQAIRAGEPGAAIVATADYDKAVAAFKALVEAK